MHRSIAPLKHVELSDRDFLDLLLDERWRFIEFEHNFKHQWYEDSTMLRWKSIFNGCDADKFDFALRLLRSAALESWPFILRNSRELIFQMEARLYDRRKDLWLVRHYLDALVKISKPPYMRPTSQCFHRPGGPLSLEIPLHSIIHHIHINPATNMIVVGTDKQVLIVDLNTTLTRYGYSHAGSVSCVVMCENGSRVASACIDGNICVWDVQSSKAICENLPGHYEAAHHLVMDISGRHVAATTIDGAVQVWNINDSKLIFQHRPSGTYIDKVAISGNGTSIIFGCRKECMKKVELDISSAVCDLEHDIDGQLEFSSGVSTNGRVICGVYENTEDDPSESLVRLWETDTLKCLESFSIKEILVEEALIVSNTFEHLVRIEKNRWQLWNIMDQTLECVHSEIEDMKTAAVTMSAGRVIIGDKSGYLTVWDFSEDRPISTDLTGRKEVNPVQLVAVAEDGEKIVAAFLDDIRIIGRNKNDRFERQLPIEPAAETEARLIVTALAIKKGDNCVVLGSIKGSLVLWRVGHGLNTVVNAHENGHISNVQFCAEDKIKSVGPGAVKFWKVDGSSLTELKRGAMHEDEFDEGEIGSTSETQDVWVDQEVGKPEATTANKFIIKNRDVMLSGDSKPLAVLPLDVKHSTAWKYVEEHEMLVVGLTNGAVLKLKVKL